MFSPFCAGSAHSHKAPLLKSAKRLLPPLRCCRQRCHDLVCAVTSVQPYFRVIMVSLSLLKSVRELGDREDFLSLFPELLLPELSQLPNN